MTNQKKAYIYALFAVLLWSTVATAFKLALKYFSVIQILFYSSFFSLISFLILIIIQKKLKLLKLNRKGFFNSAGLGLINPCLYYIVLFMAYDLLPAQQAQPINFLWPLVLSLISIPFLKQKLNTVSIISLVIGFFGVFIISTRGEISFLYNKSISLAGIGLALLSTFIWSFYWIFNLKDKRDFIIKLFYNFLFGVIYISIIAVYKNEILFPDLKLVCYTVYIGLFEMGITFVLWLKALSLAKDNARISNLIYFSPFLSFFFIAFILKEEIHYTALVGLVFIVIGIGVKNVVNWINCRKRKITETENVVIR